MVNPNCPRHPADGQTLKGVTLIGPALAGQPAVRTISLDTIDEAAEALAKVSGIVHVCQQAMHYGRSNNDEELGNALWAAWDLLQPLRDALRGDDE